MWMCDMGDGTAIKTQKQRPSKRQEWPRSAEKCFHMDTGWIKVEVKDTDRRNRQFNVSTTQMPRT